MALNKDFVLKYGLTVEGTAVSSNTYSGALQVAGGAGIGGNLNVQGYIGRVGPISDNVFSNGAALRFSDNTYTDISSTGLVPWEIVNYFGQPLLDATNTNVTVTNAASVYINGAPSTASSNLSIVNPYSLYITSGTVYIGETRGSTTTFANEALQVQGGFGFNNGIVGYGGGNLYGTYNINSSEILTRATANNGQQQFPNELILLTATQAISTSTGALQLRNGGGAGISGNIYVGGRIVGLGTGTFLSTINATSTSTGALTLAGGLGVGQDLYAQNGFFTSGTFNLTNYTGNSLQVTNGGGLGVSGTGYFGGQAYFNAQIDASNTQSGSVIINGGLGVANTIWAQDIVVADASVAQSSAVAPLVVAGGVGIGQNLIIGSSISSTGTTATNAVVVAGGVSIGKDITVNGNAVIRGDLLLLGTGKQVVVDSTNTYIVDPVIDIGGGVDGSMLQTPDIYDKGLMIHYQPNVSTLTDYRAIIGLDHTAQHFFLKNNILPNANGFVDITQLYTTGSWATLEAGSLILHDSTPATVPGTGALIVPGGISSGKTNVFSTDTTFLGYNYNLTTTTGNTVYVPNGGVGAKYLYAEQAAYVGNSQVLTTGTINGTIGGVFTLTFHFTNLTQSTSTTTGAIIIDGGLGLGGNLNMGGTFVTTGTAYVWSNQTSNGTGSGALTVVGGVGIGGNLNVGGQVSFLDTNNAFTSSGGAFTVAGGVGIAQDVWLGGILDIGQSARVGTDLEVDHNLTILGTDDSPSRSVGAVTIAGGLGVAQTINATRININTASVNSGSQSTGTTFGDLVVAGGVGIGLDTWIGGNTHILSTTTVSSTTGSGALEVWGGVGVGGGLYVAGSVKRVGDVQANKWTVNGPGLQLSTSTYTDLTSVGINAGTAVIHSINKPNLVGTLNPTWRDIATLFIENSPTIVGGAAAANQWALWVNDGQVKIGSNSVNNGSTNSGALVVTGGIGAGGSITSGATVKGVTVQIVNNQIASTSTVGIASNSQITVDTFNAGAFRTAKYLIQIIDTGYVPNRFQSEEMLIAYDGSAQTNGAYISEYGVVTNTGELGNFDAVYNGGLINIVFTPNYVPTNMAIQVLRTAITSS